MSFVDKKWVQTQFENFADKLESVFVKASSLATVAKSGKYTDLIDKPTLVGISANTLSELVEKIMYNPNLRSDSGNVKIANGVIESLPADWYQFIATWQNNYDQDAYNIGLILVLSNSSFTNKWYRVSIDGRKGSYTVQKVEYVEFGSNGAVIAKTNLTNNLLANVAGVSALDAAVGPVIQGQIDDISSNLSELGTVYNNFTSDMYEGENLIGGKFYNLCHIVLGPGTYIVTGKANIVSNELCSVLQGFYADGSRYGENSVNTKQRYIESIHLFNLSKTTTIYLRGYISSTISVSGAVHSKEMLAVRLK